MTRFLNLASKALAVIGVLTLMYAGGGMQSAKAGEEYFPCFVAGNACHGWSCPIWTCCCYTAGPITNDNGTTCCHKSCVPC